MKKLVILLLIVSSWTISSCDDCNCDGLAYGEIRVKLTIDDDNPEVFVTIFDGNIENQDTLYAGWESDTYITISDFEAERRYSATAHYVRDGRNYIAVDGKKMSTSSDDCDCSYTNGITLNLRLK